ncbi:Dolichol-phosphate mannosyltransferase [Purpureocillium lavendulum]|uniref:Dolichol-phosphate mannosyltransferase n=1 Tax=Purpureocillium lavendulum TaxID=1247861 RepID=A0AB34G2T4_9HYPO|nr:Dolichol-phosphate mannosyltransferase [Purpureocillium lavendulum]
MKLSSAAALALAAGSVHGLRPGWLIGLLGASINASGALAYPQFGPGSGFQGGGQGSAPAANPQAGGTRGPGASGSGNGGSTFPAGQASHVNSGSGGSQRGAGQPVQGSPVNAGSGGFQRGGGQPVQGSPVGVGSGGFQRGGGQPNSGSPFGTGQGSPGNVRPGGSQSGGGTANPVQGGRLGDNRVDTNPANGALNNGRFGGNGGQRVSNGQAQGAPTSPIRPGQGVRVGGGTGQPQRAPVGTGPGAVVGGSTCQTAQAVDACRRWVADTRIVSSFLDSNGRLQGPTLAREGQRALQAELDELNHKATLDQACRGQVTGPSQRLTSGSFDQVVNALRTFSQNGAAMSPGQVQSLLQTTNRNRCANVLPNIDAYCRAAGSPERAERPRACQG